ncbi:MAG: hydrogenase 4 subunit B [Deltaproteobacteria bacterium]|nr:hydrogenase 4 subunit B [Deltaproteobacteria bacterium]MCL4874723.1 hydrogenase 4 subunit B [bacterium]
MQSPLDLSIASVIVLLCASAAAPLLSSKQKHLVTFTFAASAFASLLAFAGGLSALYGGAAESVKLLIGLPDLPFYLRLDPLSGFFIMVVAALGFCVSIYSIGYVRSFIGRRSVTPLAVFYCLFMAGMLLVLLSDDAYSFMVSWELMALSSFLLVCFEDERPQNRKAAFIYLLIAHIGAILILLSFGLLAGNAAGFTDFSGYTFQAMRESGISGGWASAAFLLGFFGFAAKAGVVPLHAWLPEAHPAAPSNVSALMSGAMLKTAVYGMARLSFDLLPVSAWWWGGLVLTLGLISALMGVLYALMQHDLKRLLAYHSVENIGIILIGLGLAMIFTSFNMPLMAALALTAGLYHTLNHAMFKGLLFMGSGAVLHATGQRNMEGMGGLIHRMPWTAPLFLVGCLSISALPPLNGFVSEWLTFQSFLLSPVLPSRLLNILIPLGAAMLALTGVLAAACFVKVFGVVFLGRWRGRHKTEVHEVGWSMRAGMGLTAFACIALGVFPTLMIDMMNSIPGAMLGVKLDVHRGLSWIWLAPVSAERASYSAPIALLGICAAIAAAYIVAHARKTAVRRAPAWDCGFEKMTSRMQYNATSFSMPIRRIFGFLFSIKEGARASGKHPSAFFPGKYTYTLRVRDRLWYFFYKPAADVSFWLARKAGKLQHGRIQIYLLYSFVTLIALLVFA